MIIGYLFAAITAAIHVYIFALETFLWGHPKTNKLYNISPENAETVRIFIFNQGYYNLFLAIAIFAGIAIASFRSLTVGQTLVIYGCLSIVAAAVVLFASAPHLLRAALIQGLPPAIALAFLLGSKFLTRT